MPGVVPRRRTALLIATLISAPLLLAGCRADRPDGTPRSTPASRPSLNPADYEGVCADPPVPVRSAAVYLGGFGPHPIVFAGPDTKYQGELPATWRPADPYKVELVACVERAGIGSPTVCPYTDDSGQNYTRSVYHTPFRIRLFGASNAKLIADLQAVASGLPGGRLEEGGRPKDECPSTIKALKGFGPGNVNTTLTARDIMEVLDKYVR